MRTHRTTTLFGALALTAILGACGSGGSDEATTSESPSSPTTSEAASAVEESASLTVTDPWVKSAESGMTAVFGTLVNSGDADVTVVSAEADITDRMELHETVENGDGSVAMQPKEGGFVVPAAGEHELAPGGDHLMMMDLLRGVEPGEVVTITLTFDDGSTTVFEATVKAFTGADEEYQDGDMHMGSDDSGTTSGTDMGSDDGSSEDS